jgi:uncharacterized damage-inducible protein DinB
MSVSADVLRTHLDYTAWATSLLLDAAAHLSPQELTRGFQTADRSFSALQNGSPPLCGRFRAWAANLTHQQALQQFSFRNTQGNPWR